MAEPASRSSTRPARVLCLAAATVAAALLAPPQSRGQDAKPPSWQPKAPEGLPTDFDWIRLPSDEWLKGKILSMYDGKLEFDSDELGVHTFDFADIKELRSSRVLQVGLADKAPVTGRLVVADGTAKVIADAGETAFARSEILTIVVGARREIDYWSGYANLGGTIRSGNSDQIDYTGRLGTVRRSVGTAPGSTTSAASPASTARTRPATPGHPRLGPLLDQAPVPQPRRPRVVPRPVQNVANRWTVTAGRLRIVDTPVRPGA